MVSAHRVSLSLSACFPTPAHANRQRATKRPDLYTCIERNGGISKNTYDTGYVCNAKRQTQACQSGTYFLLALSSARFETGEGTQMQTEK